MSNTSTSHPQPIVIPPSNPHAHTIILLHGLSTNGSILRTQLLSTALTSAGLTLPQAFPGVKFVFPSGALRTCTALNGTVSNSWFDIASVADRTVGEDQQIEGLTESTTYLCELMRTEIAILKSIGKGEDDLALLGFSQGSAMGAWVLLNSGLTMGAFVGLSGWLPFRRQIDAILAANGDEDQEARSLRVLEYMNATVPIPCPLGHCTATEKLASLDTPVFLGHGKQDVKVRTEWGEEMRMSLEGLGMDVTWRGFEGLEHWWRTPDEIDDIEAFLRGRGFQ